MGKKKDRIRELEATLDALIKKHANDYVPMGVELQLTDLQIKELRDANDRANNAERAWANIKTDRNQLRQDLEALQKDFGEATLTQGVLKSGMIEATRLFYMYETGEKDPVDLKWSTDVSNWLKLYFVASDDGQDSDT